MKVLNICVNGIYTDGYTYHENLLPKYHKKLGHDVWILASEYEFDKDGKIKKAENKEYIDENGINIIRLKIKKDKNIGSKFKRFESFFEIIEIISPDIIFCHLFQFLDVKNVVRYKKRYPNVKIFFDSHADYINSARNLLSKSVLHKMIWKHYAQMALPYAEKFYGVLPLRVEFLREIYCLPEEKTELLVMGMDDELANEAEEENKIKETRNKLKIGPEDFLIVTGGKINKDKSQILELMKVVQNMNVKLVVFGPVAEDIQKEFAQLCGVNVIYAGWLCAKESYALFAASDLVVFPSTHSVYWEQVAGQGIPMIVRHWNGIEHIDIGGNVRFIYKDGVDEINKVLQSVIMTNEYKTMSICAKGKGKELFSYYRLAQQSIDCGM